VKPRPKSSKLATDLWPPANDRVVVSGKPICRPADHAQFIEEIRTGKIDPAEALEWLARDLRGVDEWTLDRARAQPSVRRKIIAQMEALGPKRDGALPPADIEIAAVWRAFKDHYPSHDWSWGPPSRNAAIGPIAKRLEMRSSRVRTILYEHEPPEFRATRMIQGKTLR
jgi:hypothetical protein